MTLSPADLIDRISILRVKMRHLHVDLSAEVEQCVNELNGLDYSGYLSQLEELNEIGWEGNQVVIDAVNGQEPGSPAELRHVWRHIKIAHLANMKRNRLKNEINEAFNYQSKELKSWQ